MPIIEEVNDDATDGGHSASHSGSGDRTNTQSATSSASTSAFSRLMVCAIPSDVQTGNLKIKQACSFWIVLEITISYNT